MLNTLNQTDVPIWEYEGFTFKADRVLILFLESGDYEEETYEITYEPIEDQTSRSSSMASELIRTG